MALASVPSVPSIPIPPARARSRPFLVSSTKSPLANPETPIHRLASELQSILYFPDPGPLYAVAGTLAANTMLGYPVWLMLIGPPESGKTELLKPLLGIAGVRECGDISGKAALLSATRAKDITADATGGLLKDLPKAADGTYRGALVMLDFARTVLASDPTTTRSVLGSLGMLHDQHWQREVGTDGGKTLSFYGRIGFLAACTDVIDHPDHQQANAEMGERCIYYRYPDSDGYHEINSALRNPDGGGKSRSIKDLFATFAEEAQLDWQDETPPRQLTDSERVCIGALAQFCARGRSGVQRDRYNKNEITGISRSALGPRLANSFAQLLRGCERIGCTVSERLKIMRTVAFDSIPAIRAETIKALRNGDDSSSSSGGSSGKTVNEIARTLRVSVSTAKRTLEDLAAHDLLVNSQSDSNGRWLLSDSCTRLLIAGWDDSLEK